MMRLRLTLLLAISSTLVIQITAPPVLPNEVDSKPKKSKEVDPVSIIHSRELSLKAKA